MAESLTRQEIADRIFDLEQKNRHDARDRAELEDLRRQQRELPEEARVRPSLAELLETPAGLRAWLQGQPPDREFRARKACHCPLAEFVVDELGERPAVGRTDVTVGPETVPLRDWAQRFVARVDDAQQIGAPITAARCLSILRKLEVGE